jgi:predicted phosphohydrolase
MIKPKNIEQFIRQIKPGLDEVCVLAGDIGNPRQPNYDTFMEFISRSFKKSFVIPGNHEYYYKSVKDTNQFMMDYFRKFDNISFLNNTCETYEDFCFIGTTLWSKVTNPTYKTNDLYSIHDLDYVAYNRLNRMSVDFLEDALQNENCIVITHHMPSSSLIDVKYLSPSMRPYNQWFYCDMDHLFKPNIKAWFYGHTHMPSNVAIKDIPFLCNPIGYPGENHVLDFGKTVEL